MQTQTNPLSEQEILSLIRRRRPFTAVHPQGGFMIKIDQYQPYLCTAIHQGESMPQAMEQLCLLDKSQRYYEEDPYTADMIRSMPMMLVGLDSRYAYDLNRPPSRCIYQSAWGKKVWKKAIPARLKDAMQQRHGAFYRVLETLIQTIETQFGAALVFDIHSYNHQRVERKTPLFNIGTANIDKEKFIPVVNYFSSKLAKVELRDIDNLTACDDVFTGQGYLAQRLQQNFSKTLVLPTEIKKVFMDEITGESYPLVIEQLSHQLRDSITATAAFFAKKYSRKSINKKSDMLHNQLDPLVLDIDKRLHLLARGADTLSYVNPVNLHKEKRKFLERKGQVAPEFRYRQLEIDPYLFREALYRLPINQIDDSSIQQLYRQVIDMLATRIDMLTSVGQENFLYNSLRYYGEPNRTDMANARFLLHASNFAEEAPYDISPQQAVVFFEQKIAQWGIPCKVELSGKILARAMAASSKNTLLVNRHAQFNLAGLNALTEHEVGIHLATTLNAKAQPLKVFSLGLPGNTHLQEGFAVLSEHLSGNMPLSRLKTLAYRVIAVHEMVQKNDFCHTWHELVDHYQLAPEAAFDICARVHRGGGFTKDFLYLRGLKDALSVWQKPRWRDLLVGKTGLSSQPMIQELLDRKIILPPQWISPALSQPKANDDVMNYLINSIQ
ncbi:flavohemoglobin expression-modulating QEGLA motif protein [Pelagibaculum spongiae]|uniref:Flavohemoglobin expression-modulating QEGLA motif protein n=1 Tax=Pelagibaculum spongiae TaxID=2080658 RepID=A0A2V1GQ97_9GAMM|nr:flavohemoglobin expression-modulating QEGLA motif protein [Pelagibaculum spongiae]PVZ65642.1 flavohemoglobin expression-modulating QEGLA motif protein [Pelagibaculum spongiae]